MQLAPDTVGRSYARHAEVYGDAKAWNTLHHLECWARAETAFGRGSFPDFKWLYDHLRRYWQVFRPPQGECWSEERTFEVLQTRDQEWRSRSLHEIDDDAIECLWSVVFPMVEIKPVSSGVSIVAISKFLHFWNPRLFVIVDNAVVWQKVFGHDWLWQPVLAARKRLEPRFAGREFTSRENKCDLLSYLAILRWSADVVRANTTIGVAFADHVRRQEPGAHGDVPVESFEAAAIEWLLLGLVELPPEGVTLQHQTPPAPPSSP